MKVFVMTKAVPFGEEVYIGVKATQKDAEKSLHEKYPYIRKVGDCCYAFSGKENKFLLFIREESV